MKKILPLCLVAVCAIMSASCEKIDTAGFGFPKDSKIKSNVIDHEGYHPITNGFYSRDDDGTYHILLNICDPFLSQNFGVEPSKKGIVIVANEKDFGHVIDLDKRPDFLFNLVYFNAQSDNVHIEKVYYKYQKEDLAYVDILPDGQFLLKRKIDDIIIFGVYYKGKLKEVPDLKSEIMKCYGYWYDVNMVSHEEQHDNVVNLYLQGVIPEYVEIQDVNLQYSTLLNHVRSETVIFDNVRIGDINFFPEPAMKKSFPLHHYGYDEFAEAKGRMFTIDYSLPVVLNGSQYDVEAVATLSYKGYTVRKTIATDIFTVVNKN